MIENEDRALFDNAVAKVNDIYVYFVIYKLRN